MGLNQKTTSILVIIVSVLTIVFVSLYFCGVVNIDIVMLFLGLTQLFSGLNQLDLEKQVNSKGIRRGSKGVGILCIILGVGIILFDIIKNIK